MAVDVGAKAATGQSRELKRSIGFFGLLFITEVALTLVFGVYYRLVEAVYIGPTLHFGVIDLPLRLLVPGKAAALVEAGA